MPGGALRYATDTIAEKFENGPEDASLSHHNVAHARLTATLAVELVGIAEGSGRQKFQVWHGGLFHDIVHYDDIITAEAPDLSLARQRMPRSDDTAELQSAGQLFDYLIDSGRSKSYAKGAADTVAATRYRIIDSTLVHPFIVEAQDLLTAFALSKADVLGPVSYDNEPDMLSSALRYFLEKYPDVTRLLHDESDTLLDFTHECLVALLRDYGSSEIDFMSSQIDRLKIDSQEIGIKKDIVRKLLKRFDIDMFVRAHKTKNWDWLSTPQQTKKRLRESLIKHNR